MAKERVMVVAGQKAPYDDSKAQTFIVDLCTESSAANGLVLLGLGHLVAPMGMEIRADGDVYLRMTPLMAQTVIDNLLATIPKALAQQIAGRPKPAN